VRYEEGRNGGLPRGNSKFIFLRAYRRFFLPPYEPKQPVIPNSEKPELAEVWRNEGSPSHSRNLTKKLCTKISFKRRGNLFIQFLIHP
jgi:hypothetical protein